MSVVDYSLRCLDRVQTRAVRALAAALCASLLALVFAASAVAAEPVDMGDAHDYSVLATTLTSNGPTAMSDNLGVSPGTTFAGDTAPIVLGETHLGDAEAAAAAASLDRAYGEAVLRPSTGALPANLGGASLTPGVYNTTGAMGFTAGTVLTLDGQDDPDAVFILQIGAALTVGASAEVRLVGGAKACNVFWAVGGATTVGASAKFAGTIMATDSAIGLGAGTRVDGRVLGGGVVTLSSNAIRTACTETVVVPGPAGPAGPAGADGADGADGATGSQGEIGPAGLAGAAGADGATGSQGEIGPAGLAGADGADGATGPTGFTGLTGPAGLTGPMGVSGPAGSEGPGGPAGAVADVATLCVTKQARRRTIRQGGLVGWTITVRNCGQRAASGVSVTDRLRRGATFRNRGGGRLVRGQLRWKAGDLEPGARRTYEITTRFRSNARPGKYVNRATAVGDNTQPKTGHGSIIVKPAI